MPLALVSLEYGNVAQRPMLVVVVVQNPGLRSALAAQLVGSGVNLLTAASFDSDVVERRMIRQPSMLIIDETGIDGDPGAWIERQWLDRAWERIVVLTLDAPLIAAEGDWLIYLDKKASARTIADQVVTWAGAEQATPPAGRFAIETPGNA